MNEARQALTRLGSDADQLGVELPEHLGEVEFTLNQRILNRTLSSAPREIQRGWTDILDCVNGATASVEAIAADVDAEILRRLDGIESVWSLFRRP